MPSKKAEAQRLRYEGYTYSEISRRTGLRKSTLSYHLSHIPFTPNQESLSYIEGARLKAHATKRRLKSNTFIEARREVMEEIGEISERDLLMVGIGLYAGEGSKTHDIVRLVNSDPGILRAYIKWLMLLGAKKVNFALRIHAYPETNCLLAEKYWLKELGLPQSSLQKMCIDTRTGKTKARKGTQPYGTVHLTLRSCGNKRLGVFMARKISAYIEKVLP